MALCLCPALGYFPAMLSRALRASRDRLCCRRGVGSFGDTATVAFWFGLARHAAGSEPELSLPEPLPPAVQRVEIHERLPAPRYYFDPPSARFHYGLRVALGGGAQWPSDGGNTPFGAFHLDIALAGRQPFKLPRRGPGGYWQPAIWSTAGYFYGYAPSDGSARNFFVGGLGVGTHLIRAAALRPSDSSLLDRGKNERPTVLALGWTPNIMLGRTLGSFALGVRNVLSVEVFKHVLGIHLSYDFIYVWQGLYIHDAAVSLSFDPVGLLRY